MRDQENSILLYAKILVNTVLPLFQESVIVLAKVLLPRVYENMSMQDMRMLTAERSTLNTYLRGENIEVPPHSIGFLLEGFIKSHSLVEELITSPAALWPAQGNSSFLCQDGSGQSFLFLHILFFSLFFLIFVAHCAELWICSGYKSTSFLHQGTSYYVETRARVLLIDMAATPADSTLQRRKSSILLRDQSSRSLIRDHAGLVSWPENHYKSHQQLPDGKEIDDNQSLSAKAMQLSIYGSTVTFFLFYEMSERSLIFSHKNAFCAKKKLSFQF